MSSKEERVASDMANLEAAMEKIAQDPRFQSVVHYPALDAVFEAMAREDAMTADFVFWLGYTMGEAGHKLEPCHGEQHTTETAANPLCN